MGENKASACLMFGGFLSQESTVQACVRPSSQRGSAPLTHGPLVFVTRLLRTTQDHSWPPRCTSQPPSLLAHTEVSLVEPVAVENSLPLPRGYLDARVLREY